MQGAAPAPDVVVVAPVEALPAANAAYVCVIKKPTADTELGVSLECKDHNEVVVTEVVPGSITEGSGLKVGNMIRSINSTTHFDSEAAAVDALQAATGDITVTIAPPWPPPKSTVRADPAAFRAAIEEKVRRLEKISFEEASLYGLTLTDEEKLKAFPNGCYKCAPVGWGCPTYMGGVQWMGSSNCVGCINMCFLGIPLSIFFPMASTSRHNNHWHFEGKGENGQDESCDLLVDVEKDTWAHYCCFYDWGPDCYCRPMFA